MHTARTLPHPLLLTPAARPTRTAPRPSFITAAGRFDLEAIMLFAHAEARANVARAAARGVVRRYAAALKAALADTWESARAQRHCHQRAAEMATLPASHADLLRERTAALMGIDSGRRMLAEVAMLDRRAAVLGLSL